MKKAIPTTIYNLWNSVAIVGSNPVSAEDLSNCNGIASFGNDNQYDEDY